MPGFFWRGESVAVATGLPNLGTHVTWPGPDSVVSLYIFIIIIIIITALPILPAWCPLGFPTSHEPLHRTVRHFTLDEPYARFLVFHSYLTCLYFTFWDTTIHPYEFPPEFRLKHLHLAPSCIASHCLTITLSLPYTTPGDDPLPPDHTLRAP